MIAEYIFLGVGIFYLFSFIALFRYFTILRLNEYLLASLIFLSLFVNGVIITFFGGVGTIYEVLPVMIAIFLLLIVSRYVLDSSYNSYFYTILTMMFSLSLLEIFVISLDAPIYELLQIIIFEAIRFLVGFYLYFTYSNVNLIIENSRTQFVKRSWIISGFIAMISSSYRIIDTFLYLFTNSSAFWTIRAPELELSLLIVSLGALILSIITGIVSIYFPEVFILSGQQVDRLKELYELSQLIDAQNQSKSLFFQSSLILDYLTNVAEELDNLKYNNNTDAMYDN